MKAILVALITMQLPLSVVAETTYFVVGFPPCDTNYFGPETTNAYILPITQPADIATARLRAATCGGYPQDGDFRPLFILGLGGDGTNRNVALPGQPLWSWHVDELVAWTGYITPEYPYTHPWEIERDVLNGTLTNGTQIALKGVYTVIAEVDPPLALYIMNYEPADFIVYWTHDTPNTVYTVEWTQSLSNPQWQSLTSNTPGVVVLPKALQIGTWAINGGYFRLRLDPKPAGP